MNLIKKIGLAVSGALFIGGAGEIFYANQIIRLSPQAQRACYLKQRITNKDELGYDSEEIGRMEEERSKILSQTGADAELTRQRYLTIGGLCTAFGGLGSVITILLRDLKYGDGRRIITEDDTERVESMERARKKRDTRESEQN